MTAAMSDTQVSGGTIISPPSPKTFLIAAKVNKFAEDPELTKTLYLTPSHWDHSLSNA